MKIRRRDFLKLGLLTSAAGVMPRSLAAQSSAPPAAPQRLLVIGAGLAGLVAAYELKKLGHAVTVLEAQRRAGGRVLTVREPFSDDLYAEAGAARIPDNHEITLRYVREFDLPLTPFYPATGSRMYAFGGQRIRADVKGDFDLREVPLGLKPEERASGMWPLLEKYLGAALVELGDPGAIDYSSAIAKKYDAMTMAEYLRQQGASEAANDLLGWPWASAQDDRTSLLWNLREIAYEAGEKTRSKILGGNDRLPRSFAAALKDDIHYGVAVVRLEQDAAGVRVVALRNGTHETFAADRLICTIPFPALRGIEVQPAFSAAKRRAIDELGYDTIVRTTLQCRTRYWEREGFNGFGHSDTPQQIWHFTHDQPGPRGLLVSFLAGGVGERVGALTAAEREEFVVTQMERAHPGLVKNLEGLFVKVWHKDPWTKGALALPRAGQLTSICVGAEKPEGRIHFAGEHLSNYSGWMQGALESGLRAVNEIGAAR